jgi:hypothetical protein
MEMVCDRYWNDRIQQYNSDGEFILKRGFEDTGGQAVKRTPHQLIIQCM